MRLLIAHTLVGVSTCVRGQDAIIVKCINAMLDRDRNVRTTLATLGWMVERRRLMVAHYCKGESMTWALPQTVIEAYSIS